MPAGKNGVSLTEHEGMLLALIVRKQPIRPYQLYKFFEQSPVTSNNSSKGQIYPAIRRLKEKGLISSRQVGGQSRKVEELTVTEAGVHCAASWVMEIGDVHINLEDPLRTRMLTFGLLTKDERIAWIGKAQSLIKARRQAIEEFNRKSNVPYQRFAYLGTMATLRVKMEWLDELLREEANAQ